MQNTTAFGTARVTESGRPITNGRSIFRQNIQNTAGLDQIEAQATLKNYALADSRGYTKMRAEVYVDTLRAMLQKNYDIIWDLLSQGHYPKGSSNAQIIVDGAAWSPSYPDQEINEIAQGFSISIKQSFHKLMKEVLPDDYKDMAEERLKNAAKVEGALDVTLGNGSTAGSN